VKTEDVHLLVSGRKSDIKTEAGKISLTIPQIYDHEIIAIDLNT